LLEEKYTQAYMNADLIIDLSGDSFADTRFSSLINCLGFFPGILLNKPIVLFSQSIGPFRFISYPFVKFCLNRAKLITARGQITKSYLQDLKINPQIFLVSDCAFILEAATSEVVERILTQEEIPLNPDGFIGISVSAILARKKREYVEMMVQMIDWIIQERHKPVLLISHAYLPTEDDRLVARKIYNKVINKDHLFIVQQEYSAEDLKGLIGRCVLFIGSRMHAAIAAFSMGIPTLVLAYSHKYYEIIKELGQDQFVCDIRSLTLQQLVLKFDTLWKNRDAIRMELTVTLKKQKELAVYGGVLVNKELMRSRQQKGIV
jgi:polysaccharide pyruvyl transferase WcaK-like protein